MEKEHGLVRLSFLLELASLELQQLKGEMEGADAEKIRKSVQSSIESLKKMYFTGPHGYDPGPTFEKCPTCSHYRLKK